MPRFLVLFCFLSSSVFAQLWPTVATSWYNWLDFQKDPTGNFLYIGGQSQVFNNQQVYYIVRWDGTTAVQLGNGVYGGSNPYVHSLAFFGPKLIAAGKFDFAGTATANNIAAWTGTSWQSLGLGMNGPISSLQVYNNELYAGGLFTMAGGSPITCIAKWDNFSWSQVGNGITDSVTCMEVFNGELYVATMNSKLYKWDGSTWTLMTTVTHSTGNAYIHCMKNFNNQLYVGGDFETINGNSLITDLASYDGTNWSDVGQASFTGNWSSLGVYGLVGSGGTLFITGTFEYLNSIFVNSVAAWNGTSWSALGGGVYDGGCIEIFQGDLYVASRNRLRKLDSTLSIQDLRPETGIYVYPNPTSGEINFQLPWDFNEGLLEVYDMSGKKTFDKVIDRYYKLHLDLQPGLYQIVLSTPKERMSCRVLLVH
jgi:hypothetical protein